MYTNPSDYRFVIDYWSAPCDFMYGNPSNITLQQPHADREYYHRIMVQRYALV